jgi:glycosyltransferase involved in cell wall biosynthesis
MKVLMLNHFPLEGSGSGVYTRNLAIELIHLGYEVEVIVPETKPVDTTTLGFKTHVVLFEADRTIERVSGANAAEMAETTNVQDNSTEERVPFPFPCFTTHPMSHRTFYDLSTQEIESYKAAFKRQLEDVVAKFKPDLIHVGHLWTLAALARETGVPYVVTSHGTDLMGFMKDPRYRMDALDAGADACKVITISEKVDRDVQMRFGVASSRRSLIHNGCDTRMFYRREISREDVLREFGLPPELPRLVCFAGKLVPFKGVDLLLRAAAIYEEALGAQVATLIVGDGISKMELMHLAETLRLKNVRFAGYQPQNRLADIYSASDVFAMPSRSEPFGLVALEALACGLPVVATESGGITDYLSYAVGRLVPEEDPEALSNGLLDILRLPEAGWNKMSESCRALVAKKYSWADTARKTAEVYEACLKR